MTYLRFYPYCASVKSKIRLTHFYLVYGVKSILPIQCEMNSLKLSIYLLPNTRSLEKFLLYMQQLDEHGRDIITRNEAHKNCIKYQSDKLVHPSVFSKGDMVIFYDQYGHYIFPCMQSMDYIFQYMGGNGGYRNGIITTNVSYNPLHKPKLR